MNRLAKSRAFTLVELLVVISIIAILAGALLANFGKGTAKSRDAERQSDIRNVESALEIYRLRNGRYPEACNGPSSGRDQLNWSGQLDTDFECSNGTGQYIVDLAPEFISVLPKDPLLNGSDSGYVYAVSEDGRTFKFMALNTVETESVGADHAFSRCGNVSSSQYECQNVPQSPTVAGSNNTPAWCQAGTENDYAVKSGFANGGTWSGNPYNSDLAREYFSEVIRCK